MTADPNTVLDKINVALDDILKVIETVPGVTARIGTRHIKNTGKNFNSRMVAKFKQKQRERNKNDEERR